MGKASGKHGISKRRTWRKLHIAIDGNTQCVVGAVLTTNSVGDSEAFGPLIGSIQGDVKSVTGDGGYNTVDCYDTCECYGARSIIPPRRGSRKSDLAESLDLGNEAIDTLSVLGGDDEARKKWKQEVGYHHRSLVETFFCRHKTIFDPTKSGCGKLY